MQIPTQSGRARERIMAQLDRIRERMMAGEDWALEQLPDHSRRVSAFAREAPVIRRGLLRRNKAVAGLDCVFLPTGIVIGSAVRGRDGGLEVVADNTRHLALIDRLKQTTGTKSRYATF